MLKIFFTIAIGLCFTYAYNNGSIDMHGGKEQKYGGFSANQKMDINKTIQR
ncbi:hypothetical protein [Campylobacter pinnipediorum]|uniref:hypothetical protein n=1 Tax=Campylobacter pinnipediorum TaxID=1965231 RepID=UPI001300D597|nr:hypothetical protein [Campylobacter pinnipediorum]